MKEELDRNRTFEEKQASKIDTLEVEVSKLREQLLRRDNLVDNHSGGANIVVPISDGSVLQPLREQQGMSLVSTTNVSPPTDSISCEPDLTSSPPHSFRFRFIRISSPWTTWKASRCLLVRLRRRRRGRGRRRIFGGRQVEQCVSLAEYIRGTVGPQAFPCEATGFRLL